MMSLLACQRLSPSGPGAGGAQRSIALRFMAMSISSGVNESCIRTAVAEQVTDALQRLTAAQQVYDERHLRSVLVECASHYNEHARTSPASNDRRTRTARPARRWTCRAGGARCSTA